EYRRKFLPIDQTDLDARGIEQVDFVLITGDAYIDDPSFGAVIIARFLEHHGYSVALIAQPDYKSKVDFMRCGKPRLAYLVCSGTVDSMVANFSVTKNRRRTDELTPGGKAGQRPDRALIVYANRCKEAYRDVPIIIGGLEASLRRFAHYDYWSDKVRRSILLDTKADILVYGMGERAILEVARALDDGFAVRDITWIGGTCVRVRSDMIYDSVPVHEDLDMIDYANANANKHENEKTYLPNIVALPSFSEVSADTEEGLQTYAKSFVMQYDHNDYHDDKSLVEAYDNNIYVTQIPPMPPLETVELDEVYDIQYTYDAHPIYAETGLTIPALHETQFSMTHVRGCFGNCAFCAITYHQGRIPTSRSKESLVREAKRLVQMSSFKGYIHDLGGPTANFRGAACDLQEKIGACKRKDCLYPVPCKKLRTSHKEYIEILKEIRNIKGIKKVFIRSGVRYDYLLADQKYGREFLTELVNHHVSGTLKVAPEHASAEVLHCMRKPAIDQYETFAKLYHEEDARRIHRSSKSADGDGKKVNVNPQYLIPYFISSHPGSKLEDAYFLAKYMNDRGEQIPDQVQDFYPTPGTLATCMYYTGMDPFTMESVYIPGRKYMKEKNLQRALLHYKKPENRNQVYEALQQMGVNPNTLLGGDPNHRRGARADVRGSSNSSNSGNSGNAKSKGKRNGKHKGIQK
ncbi:MAG: YgiQ family radical SAM protein, partial [Clostridiales Family XIII bacterium]|nr:YgiQ family radical SAM protein [Clostridiales Family XIII bacterium]